MKRAFVALTGASGQCYGVATIKALQKLGVEVHATISSDALKNAEVEYNSIFPTIESFLDKVDIKDIHLYNENNMAASVASGSFRINYYIIAPASMGFIGRVAAGVSINLAERVADVAIKEKKPLSILFREMPLSSIHLENLLKLSNVGATVLPAAPAFYTKPETIDDMVTFTVGKLLDALNIEHSTYKRWGD